MTDTTSEHKNMDFRQSLRAAAALQAELTATLATVAALSEQEMQHRAAMDQARQDIATLKRMILDQTQKTLTAERKATKAIKEGHALRARIQGIHRSTSWRITAPFRTLKDLLKSKPR